MEDRCGLAKDKATSASSITRRRLIQGGVAVALAAPAIISRPARAAGQVVVRTSGGAYGDAINATIHDPFTKATGIEVVPVASTIGKLFAMYRSGNIELDVIDSDQVVLIQLEREGALEPLNYSGWKFADPNQIDAEVRKPHHVGHMYFSWVNTYNTETFPNGTHPKNWSEYWDTKRFPGARTLPDLASGQPPLEFALLADGVPKDKLYPLDIDRAFKSLDRIKPSVKKFWDTGALSVELLTSKEVVLGALWNARAQLAIDSSQPLAMEWTDAMYTCDSRGIFKGAKNLANAQMLIDFASQPQIQADFLSRLPYGPTNSSALKLMSPEAVSKLPTTPERKAQAFALDTAWWDANRQAVSDRWSTWLLAR